MDRMTDQARGARQKDTAKTSQGLCDHIKGGALEWFIVMVMRKLSGQAAIVTGGSRGIGLGIARALVENGAHVAITGRTDERLQAAARELQGAAADGATVTGLRTDVRSYAEVERLMNRVAEQHGGLDILINNAGVGLFRAVADMSPDEWHSVVDTNLTGVFYCCHAALPHLRARGGGWIINISSLAGKNPFPEAAAYCASKSGLNAFSDALMQEVRYDGIRVACVMPGSVATDFGSRGAQKGDWALTPADVAEVVIDLIRHPSRSLPSRVEIRPARPPKK
jgi:NAD(P)-dependent dehydrogenase (short-subunit alcohol dehydrogenase family)